MTTAGPQLDYAPGAPIRRRRRVRRMMGLLLGAGFVLTGWWFHAPVWQHAKLLYYQRQCLYYTAPPEQVVYDENNGTVSPLIGTPGYRAMPSWQSYINMRSGKLLRTVAVRPAPELVNYAAAKSWVMPQPPATVFLHERRTKSGLVRLVAVTRQPTEPGVDAHDLGLGLLVITPAGVMSQPDVHPVLVGGGSSSWPLSPADTQNLRFYAGQPDPADPAHFTIKYDLRSGSGIIDGRLNEDGQTVSLKILSGPALGTSWVIDRPGH